MLIKRIPVFLVALAAFAAIARAQGVQIATTRSDATGMPKNSGCFGSPAATGAGAGCLPSTAARHAAASSPKS